MAIFTTKPHSIDVIEGGTEWRNRCLVEGNSVLGSSTLWTTANLKMLRGAFLSSPLGGSESFIDKLTKQLAGTPAPVKQLAAECIWLLYLFVSSDRFGAPLKR